MLNYKQIWHGIKPIRWLNKFNLTVPLLKPFGFKLLLGTLFTFPLHSLEFEILCVALWMIWNCRNKFIFENKTPCSDGLWSRASVYVMELMEVNKNGLTVPTAPDRKWSPPLSDSVFKLNLTLSQSRSKASVGVGFLIRNSEGEVLAASCERVRKELHSLWTAAAVVRNALVFCQNTCFSKVIVESNFAEPVDLINQIGSAL